MDLFSTEDFTPADHAKVEKMVGAFLTAQTDANPATAQKACVAFYRMCREILATLSDAAVHSRVQGLPCAFFILSRTTLVVADKEGTIVIQSDTNDRVQETVADPSRTSFDHPDLAGHVFERARPFEAILADLKSLTKHDENAV